MVKKEINPLLPSQAQVEKYEISYPVLAKVLSEVKELSKKKQDAVLNKLKVKMVNRILEEIRTFLANQPTAKFLDLLDDETLPTNSDTVLILAQYQAAMDVFYHEYYVWDGVDHRWLTKEKP